MTTPTLEELRTIGYKGIKVGSFTRNPNNINAPDEEIAAELIKAIDDFLNGDFEEVDFD